MFWKIASLLFVLSVGCKSECLAAPRNESVEGGPCREYINFNLNNVLEEFRDHMHFYLPTFGIPPLDPLSIEEINLNGDLSQFLNGINVQMTNLTATGLNQFIASDLDMNVIGFYLNLTLTIPNWNILGDHVSTGALFGIVPVEGSGIVNLTIHNITIGLSGRLNFTGEGWEVPQLAITFTISGISGGFEGLSDPFFNDLLNLSAPEILELAWPEFEPVVTEAVRGAVVSFLNEFTLEELMGLLFGQGLDWSNASPTPPAPIPTEVPTEPTSDY